MAEEEEDAYVTLTPNSRQVWGYPHIRVVHIYSTILSSQMLDSVPVKQKQILEVPAYVIHYNTNMKATVYVDSSLSSVDNLNIKNISVDLS